LNRNEGLRAAGFFGAVALPAVLFSLPVGALIFRAFQRQLAGWGELFLRPRVGELLLSSLSLTALVLIFSTVLALPLAWLTSRREFAGKRVALGLITLPMGLPGYISAWSFLSLPGINGQPRGVLWAALAMTLYSFPLLAWNLRQGFLSTDPRFEESAMLLGKDRYQRFWKVVLPQLRPAFLSGWIFLSLYVLSDFGVPYLFGVDVLASAIYVEIIASFDPTSASVLSLFSMVLAGLLLTAGSVFGRSSVRARLGKHEGENSYRIVMSAKKAWILLVIFLAPSFLIPAASLSYWLPLPGVWENFFKYNTLISALLGSLSYGAAAGLLGTVTALGMVLVRQRRLYPFSSLPYQAALFPGAVPGTALGLGWVLVFLGFLPWLYQTGAGFVLALGVSAVALAAGPIRTALGSHSPSWHESAVLLGKSRLQSFVRVVLPGLKSALLGSFVLSMGWVMRELPMTLLLSPLGTNTLPVAVFGRTVESDYAGAAPYALVLVIIGGILGWTAGKSGRTA